MIFPDIDPIVHIGPWALQWGPLALRWYALAYVAGILLGWQYAIRLVRDARLWGGQKPTATSVQIDDLVLWITLGIILGGRIGYILFYMLVNDGQRASLAQDPLAVFKIWEGGMLGMELAVPGKQLVLDAMTAMPSVATASVPMPGF